MDATTAAIIGGLIAVIVIQNIIYNWPTKYVVPQETHVIPSRKIAQRARAAAYPKEGGKRAPKFKSDAELAAIENETAWAASQAWEEEGNL